MSGDHSKDAQGRTTMPMVDFMNRQNVCITKGSSINPVTRGKGVGCGGWVGVNTRKFQAWREKKQDETR